MGLKHLKSLRSFAEELASDAPSPGGGTAAAASGAFAAALLRMVSMISAKSKKLQVHAPELRGLASLTGNIMEELLRLAEKDADSYDLVVAAMRAAKKEMGPASKARLTKALKTATEVPLKTAENCVRILELSADVARLGIKSASSDTGVAVLLAEAGVKGAAMNVRINLRELDDPRYVVAMGKKLRKLETRANTLSKAVLGRL